MSPGPFLLCSLLLPQRAGQASTAGPSPPHPSALPQCAMAKASHSTLGTAPPLLPRASQPAHPCSRGFLSALLPSKAQARGWLGP